jgi:hypothetical protein
VLNHNGLAIHLATVKVVDGLVGLLGSLKLHVAKVTALASSVLKHPPRGRGIGHRARCCCTGTASYHGNVHAGHFAIAAEDLLQVLFGHVAGELAHKELPHLQRKG